MSRKRTKKGSESELPMLPENAYQQKISPVVQNKIVDAEPRIGHEYSDFLLHRIQNLTLLQSKIKPGLSISRMPEDLLIALLEQLSQADMVVRAGIIGGKDYGYVERRKKVVQHIPIEVSQPQNTVLRISMPPLVGRKFRGSYNIYWALKTALEEYGEVHGIDNVQGEKLLLIYKRYAKNLSVCYTCDNDNWEAKRITNALAEALNYSDNAEHFSMLYTSAKSDVDRMEATVILMKNLPLFTGYICESFS